MKKIIFKALLVSGLLVGLSQAGNAQRVFVKIRPEVHVVEARPAAPSHRHVWVEGEWTWSGGRYVEVPGHWVLPEPHRHWVGGHWRRAYGGWNWVPGHWARM